MTPFSELVGSELEQVSWVSEYSRRVGTVCWIWEKVRFVDVASWGRWREVRVEEVVRSCDDDESGRVDVEEEVWEFERAELVMCSMTLINEAQSVQR